MSAKVFRNILSGAIGIALLFTLMTPAGAASQSTPEPMYDFIAYGVTKSIDPVTKEQTDAKISGYTTAAKSFIYNDTGVVPHKVKVYDNHGSEKIRQGDVTVHLRRFGQLNSGIYTFLDGKEVFVTGEGSGVISSYPNTFICNEVYTFRKDKIDPEVPYSIFTATAVSTPNKLNNNKSTRYEVDIYIYWDHSTLPEGPEVSFKYDPASEQMLLSGVDSSMEYRWRGESTDAWKPCTDEPMLFDGTVEGKKACLVRYAATGETPASQAGEAILPAKRYAPSLNYSKVTESLSGLTTQMEVQVNDGPYIAATGDTMSLSDAVSAIPNGDTATVRLRYKATATQQPSINNEFTIHSRSQAPSGLQYDPVTSTLTGYTTAMQFQSDTGTTWTALSGTSWNLAKYARADRDVEIYVRYKPTSTASASLPVIITIPQLAPEPVGSIDYANEAITNLQNGDYEYSANATAWGALTVTNGTWDISSRIKSTPINLYLRWAKTDSAPASAYSTFAVPGRPAAPSTPKFVYNDLDHPGKAVLTGLSAGMQYKKSTDTAWINITDANANGIVFDIPNAAVTYYVRTSATDQAFTSYNKSLTLAKPGTAPNCAYNSTTEIISSLATTMEMQIGTGAYTPVSGTTFSVTELIDSLPSGSNLVIRIRRMATATAPASAEKTFTLYSRGAAPTTLVYNSAANSLSGCSTAMQYRLDSSTAWTAITGTTLSLQKYASVDRDVKVYVRTKATTTAAASLPVEFVIPQMVVGPTGTISYLDEAIVGLSNGNYQYSTNGTSWAALTITNESWDISSLIGTSAKTLYLRKAATDTAPVSAYTSFSIAARPVAPTAPKFIYNDSRYPGKAVLSGLSSGMQYKKSTDAVWTNVTDANVNEIVFDTPQAAGTYYVRNGTTNAKFASANKSLTLVKPGAVPNCIYNSTTEIISSLSTSMEMRIGDGLYTRVTGTTFSTTALIDGLPSGSNLIIRIRIMATATAPASAERVITLYSRGAAPTTLVYDPTTNSLSGCSSAMQYKLDTATGWTAITGTTLNLQRYASASREVKVYVRTKPTTTAAASIPVEFIIPQKVSNTIATTDYLDDPTDTESTIPDVTIPESTEQGFEDDMTIDTMTSDTANSDSFEPNLKDDLDSLPVDR